MEEYEYLWITPEMFSEGWHELVNGVVYHRDYSESQIVRRDKDGNCLIRIPKPPPRTGEPDA